MKPLSDSTEEGYLPPDARQQIVDVLVRHVHEGSPQSGSLDVFKEWLQYGGWDDLVADWGDACAIKSREIAKNFFNDECLADCEGVVDVKTIDDGHRLSFARMMLEEKLGEGELAVQSIHPYKLKSSDGRTAVMGVTLESHGQGGHVPIWHGFFKDEDEFMPCLRQTGHWLSAELGTLEDEEILALWSRPKRARASSRKT